MTSARPITRRRWQQQEYRWQEEMTRVTISKAHRWLCHNNNNKRLRRAQPRSQQQQQHHHQQQQKQSTSLSLSQQQQQEAQMSARSQQIRKATPASKHLILTQQITKKHESSLSTATARGLIELTFCLSSTSFRH